MMPLGLAAGGGVSFSQEAVNIAIDSAKSRGAKRRKNAMMFKDSKLRKPLCFMAFRGKFFPKKSWPIQGMNGPMTTTSSIGFSMESDGVVFTLGLFWDCAARVNVAKNPNKRDDFFIGLYLLLDKEFLCGSQLR